ncbi:MAG: hypothetical protein LBQ92_03770 [Propionibacteriaceae bacterium]|jgi:hypothetical protein|nr:hypothetical protein [Propionibacteriaceae bacterium]
MACFLAPTAAAMVVGVVKSSAKEAAPKAGRLPLRTKLSWLLTMLAGGSVLLALEHLWHGEVVLAPPFLTAMADGASTAVMVQEIATVGVGMAVLVTVCWAVMVVAVERIALLRRVFVKAER